MPYIGKSIESGTFSDLGFTGTFNSSTTDFNLGTQVGSPAQLIVSKNGVIQRPGTDFTLASGGSQISFTTAPASGDSIFIVEISGAVGGTVTPSDTSVTADKLNTALLTGHTDIGAGIADADLFLVDDGAGGTLRKTAASRLKTYIGAGNNDPILSVGLSSTQNISDNTWTTIVMNTEILDADGIYNNSTGVATPTAGTYFMIFAANVGGDTNSSLQNAGVKFLVGSTVTAEQTMNAASNNHRYTNLVTSYIQTFDGSTTVACQAYNDVSSGQASVYGGSSPRFGATFQMFKLIT